jgi:hypothetical protein
MAKYSERLIQEVKECYPDNPAIHERAENGSPWLGRHICDSLMRGVPIEDVLKAKSIKKLKKMAMLEKRKSELYDLWNEEMLKTGYRC